MASVLDVGRMGVVLAAFHLIVSVPTSGSNSVMHEFDMAVTLPLNLPDRMDTRSGPVTVQSATEPFTRITVEVAVPLMTSGGLTDTVPITVLQVIEAFDTSIFCAHPAIGASKRTKVIRAAALI